MEPVGQVSYLHRVVIHSTVALHPLDNTNNSEDNDDSEGNGSSGDNSGGNGNSGDNERDSNGKGREEIII